MPWGDRIQGGKQYGFLDLLVVLAFSESRCHKGLMVESQVAIITALQSKLSEAIASGDWSATEQWGKNLTLASNVLIQLLSQEEIMNLKEKIDILTTAIADKGKQIETLKSKETELTEADAAADKAISDFKLQPDSVTPSPILK